MKKIILILVILLVSFTTCKKYEEGPLISFRTKKSRLLGKWEIKEFEINGVDYMASLSIDSAFCTYTFEIVGTDYEEYSRHCPSNVYSSGEWAFENNKRELCMNEFSNGPNYTPIYGPMGSMEIICWTILRLTNKEMKLKTDWNGKEYEIFYKKIKD